MKRSVMRFLGAVMSSILFIALLGTGAMAGGKVVINYWLNHGVEDAPLFDKVIANFQKLNPDIEVRVQNVMADYYQKITIAAAGGELPDVFYMRGGSGDMLYYSQGIALDITNFVNRDAKEFDLDDFLKSQVPELQYKGRWRALPYDYSTLGIFYNKGLFDEAGVRYPADDWTWGDLSEMAQKLTKREGNRVTQYGITGIWFAQWLEGYLMTWGGRLFNDDYTKATVDESANVAALQYIRDLVEKHRVAPTFGEAGVGSTWALTNVFFTGRAAMTTGGSWATMQFRANTGFPFDVAMLPRGKDGKRVISATGGSWAIAHNSKNPEAAWKFVKYLTGKDSSRILIVEPVRSLPSRRSLLPEWAEQISKAGDPAHARVFGDQVANFGRNTPTVEIGREYVNVVNNKWPLIMSDRKSVSEIAKEWAEETNRFFKK
jgi:multiple sugar transport system substrate-binding protein